jgi:hypothetical protein
MPVWRDLYASLACGDAAGTGCTLAAMSRSCKKQQLATTMKRRANLRRRNTFAGTPGSAASNFSSNRGALPTITAKPSRKAFGTSAFFKDPFAVCLLTNAAGNTKRRFVMGRYQIS